MKKTNMPREEKISLYDRLVATQTDAVRKGDTIPCTTLNGHMYSYFTKDNFLALRLPEKDRASFMDKYRTTLVQQYGVIQKEYVVVPDSFLNKTDELSGWFEISFKYVKSLKPKTSKRTKK